MGMNKEDRIKVFENTVEICNDGVYENENNEVVEIDSSDFSVDTKFYGKKVVLNYDSMARYDMDVHVTNNDTLYEAEELIKKGFKVCVLNMASKHTPGSDVTYGSTSQESEIFRRTNIFKSLFEFHYIGTQYGIDNQREERYPLEMTFGGIYTPNVTVFKYGEDKDYALMDKPFQVNVITLSPLKNPPKDENGKILPWAERMTKDKIRQILDIALENGNNALVLGAFGCGKHNNTNPIEMSRFFADVLSSEEYQGLFKMIRFAVLDDCNGEGSNYLSFKETFG